MMNWHMMGPCGGMVFMLIFWILVIVGVVFLVRWLSARGRTDRTARQNPLDILKERYARGEISREDFERMKKDLE
jgi:putative membrane protein